MKKLSSSSTFLMKKVFPITWFGFLALFVILVVTTGAAKANVMLLVLPLLMSVFGYFLMKSLIWDVMDEVFDYGNYLSVKYRGHEEIIQLSNIINVNVSSQQRPPRVTLQLRTAGEFGKEVSFFPVTEFSFNPFKKNKLIEELIIRIDNARNKTNIK